MSSTGLLSRINNDPNIDEVREWMEERNFNFMVLRDDGYLTDQQISVFPTSWFVDTQSKIRFIKEGYTEKLVEEFSWRLEAMD
ncbi:MAG: hypothetical protein FH748_10835 [Balneolaceae bacterium]|nr:hypothetical protein [Balneolaceae bacterium]